MTEAKLISIEPGELVPHALQFRHDGYRLLQICSTRIEGGYELSYSFAKGYEMVNLRLSLREEEEITSISDIFEPAFLYENEIVDLFGAKITLISLDYKGNLYRLAKKTPFK